MRLILIIVIGCAITAGVAIAASRYGADGIELASWIAGAASLIVAIATLIAQLPPKKRSEGISAPEEIDRLAMAIKRQWENEAEVRRINDPHPLPVSWSAAPPELVEDWSYLTFTAKQWQRDISKKASNISSDLQHLEGKDEDILDVFSNRTPTRRLVIVGAAGAGKTILLIRLTLALLAHRSKGDPVPIIFSLATWNPIADRYHDWLAKQITANYSPLWGIGKSASHLQAQAEKFIAAGLIVPILDGLDEMAESARGSAVARINEELRPMEPIVITCRHNEYRRAISAEDRRPAKVIAAAGIVLDDLDPAATEFYLRRDAGSPEAADRWNSVFSYLGTSHPIGITLRTPLMVSLARTIYNPRPGEATEDLPDPGNLLNGNEFDSASDIKQHLLNQFVRAAYRPHPDPAHRSQWNDRQAERWLIFLAAHLERKRIGVHDFAWWALNESLPIRLIGPIAAFLPAIIAGIVAATTPRLGIGLPIGIIVALIVGLSIHFTEITVDASVRTKQLTLALLIRYVKHTNNSPVIGLAAGLIAGVAGGLVGGLLGDQFNLGTGPMGGLIGGLGAGIAIGPVGGKWASSLGGFAGGVGVGLTSGHASGIFAGLLNFLAVWIAGTVVIELAGRREPARGISGLYWNPKALAIGLAVGIAVGMTIGISVSWTTGLVAGAVLGLVVALTLGLQGELADITKVISPTTALTADRTTFWIVGLATGLSFGIAVGFGVMLSVGFAAGITVGVAGAFLQATWGRYIICRSIHSIQGHLPWRLMDFLADAHQKRGVLRQVGAYYQFRHVELQHCLASQHPWDAT
jgi:hypothetical protein